MKSGKSFLFLVSMAFAVLVTAGCMTSETGNPKIVDPSITSQLKKGVTTEQQAIALLGQPSASSDLADGGQVISYSYAKTKSNYYVYYASGSTHIKTLSLTFDKSGILRGKSWSENNSGSAG